MKVAKRFRWECAHRLPWHPGLCRNLHGHSYAMTVELEGRLGEHGMLVDFKDLKRAIAPLVDDWDHATIVAENDAELIEAVERLGSKLFVLPYDSTAENLCRFAADYLRFSGAAFLREVTAIRVIIQETETSYATHEIRIDPPASPE